MRALAFRGDVRHKIVYLQPLAMDDRKLNSMDATPKTEVLRSPDPDELTGVLEVNPLSISYFRVVISRRARNVRTGHLKGVTSPGLVMIEADVHHGKDKFTHCIYAAAVENFADFAQELEEKKGKLEEVIDLCDDVVHVNFFRCSRSLAGRSAELFGSAVTKNLRYTRRFRQVASDR